jgi:heat shock protein HspQ
MSFADDFKESAAKNPKEAAQLLIKRVQSKHIDLALDAGEDVLAADNPLKRYDDPMGYKLTEEPADPLAQDKKPSMKDAFKKVVEEDLSTVASVYITQEQKALIYNGVEGDKNTQAAIEMTYQHIQDEEQRQLLESLRKASKTFTTPPVRRRFEIAPI